MVFTTTACGYKTAEPIWTDSEHASVLGGPWPYFPGLCATFGVQAVRVLALASALALAGKIFWGTRLRSRRVCFGRLVSHFTRSHVLPSSRLNADPLWRRYRKTWKFSDFWSFLTDLPSSRGRGLAQDGRTASQMHQAPETN